jgi:hypothetical protein
MGLHTLKTRIIRHRTSSASMAVRITQRVAYIVQQPLCTIHCVRLCKFLISDVESSKSGGEEVFVWVGLRLVTDIGAGVEDGEHCHGEGV